MKTLLPPALFCPLAQVQLVRLAVVAVARYHFCFHFYQHGLHSRQWRASWSNWSSSSVASNWFKKHYVYVPINLSPTASATLMLPSYDCHRAGTSQPHSLAQPVVAASPSHCPPASCHHTAAVAWQPLPDQAVVDDATGEWLGDLGS